MTREEAIKELESYADHSWGGLSEAFELAIVALKEQEERSKGCEYCKEYKSIVEKDGSFISFDATLSKGIFLEACTPDIVLEAKVPFCPMCGRRLEEV